MFKKFKIKAVGLLTGVGVLVSPALALAEGVADSSVTTAMQGISENIVATLGAVAPYGLAVLAIFLAFRYGKRLFVQTSKG